MSTRRRVLVDNATLSGVERLTGASRTINLNYIDNDILCLEKLVTAILFSDELIAVDDYKEEYRASRLKRFNFIDFFKIDEPRYRQLTTDAAAFARNIAVLFDGSKPTGDITSFFESLRIDPQLRWDIWVSSEYLTLTYLLKDTKNPRYEESIDSIFRNESSDQKSVNLVDNSGPTIRVKANPEIQSVKDLIEAISSNNPQYAGNDGKSALHRIIFGYGWAAERSHFYNSVAEMKGSDVYLAPLRDTFCESYCRLDYRSQVYSLVESLKANSKEAITKILEPSGGAKFAIRLPFFTGYLISKTDNPKQCIDLAISMRHDKNFQDCRTIFENLKHLSAGDKVQELNRILQYLGESCTRLMNKYAVTTGNGMQFSISLGLTGLSFGTSMKLNSLFRFHKNSSFTRVFRNIAQDMVNVERLGSLHEKLCSSIRKHPDFVYPKISTTPKFMENKDSPSGRPAFFASKRQS